MPLLTTTAAVKTGTTDFKLVPEGDVLMEISKVVVSTSGAGNPMYCLWLRPIAFVNGKSTEGYGTVWNYLVIVMKTDPETGEPMPDLDATKSFRSFANNVFREKDMYFDHTRPEFNGKTIYEHAPNIPWEQALRQSRHTDGMLIMGELAPHLPGFKVIAHIKHKFSTKYFNDDNSPKLEAGVHYFKPASEWVHQAEFVPATSLPLPALSEAPALVSFEAP